MPRSRRLSRRAVLFLLGASFVTAAATFVLEIVPAALVPAAGDGFTVTEEVAYWTPEDGWLQGVRSRTVQVRDTGTGLQWEERFSGIASPRGDRFAFEIGDDLVVAGEPRVRASFPPRPPWEPRLEHVNVGVPWSGADLSYVGAIDRFTRVGTVERNGLTLDRYEARHLNQFFVLADAFWFRAVERVAVVDPLSGIVVDYQDHETLWVQRVDERLPVRLLQEQLATREKVWEAVVQPTQLGEELLSDRATDEHQAHKLRATLGGLPLLALGEFMLWGALAPDRRARRSP